jgi:hypothetical protein
MMKLRTCVTPDKQFLYGIHKPSYTVCNLRAGKKVERLGPLIGSDSESAQDNRDNFPDGTLFIDKADWIFEIPNPFSFRGQPLLIRNGRRPVPLIFVGWVCRKKSRPP